MKYKRRFIYALCCPFVDEVHYIGMTTVGMSRPMQHLTKSHSAKVREWVKGLSVIGLAPVIKILELVSDFDDIRDRENYFIKEYSEQGHLLLNMQGVPAKKLINKFDIRDRNIDHDVSQISEFVRMRRKSVKLTQREFAKKAGVGLRFLRELERGNKPAMKLNKILDVLSMFGCTLDVSRIKKD